MPKLIDRSICRLALMQTLLCVCLATAVTSTFADDATVVPSINVRYADLNLQNPDGVAVLYARLKSASRKVCSDYESRDLNQWSLQRACYDAALSRAVAQISLPTLTMLHRHTSQSQSPGVNG